MQSEAPLVSVGIPFRNPGKAFLDAVRSVLCQKFTDWELLLINDGSSDESVALAARIRDPRVRVLDDGVGRGLVARLNQWIDLARGRYLARMDADDMMTPERLERQVEILESRQEVSVVSSSAYILDGDRRPVGVREGGPATGPTPSTAVARGVVIHPTVMARREWYQENRYRAEYPRAEDRDLFMRTLGKTRHAIVQEPLLLYSLGGKLRLTAYLQSYATSRRVVWEQGPKLVGWPATVGFIGRSWVKSMALIGAKWAGLDAAVLGRSCRGLTSNECARARSALELVARQCVPGWEESCDPPASTGAIE